MKKILAPYIKSILEFLKKENIKIHPLPKIELKSDLTESKNPIGKTAYYTPEETKIVLFVEGRYPKDILRSFVHEMMHHNQFLRLGKLDTKTENITKSKFLEKIEADAYLRGNMLFRKWENTYKNTQ